MTKKAEKKEKKQDALEAISIKITEWMGTPISIVVHSIFFAGIFLLIYAGFELDQIMLILTTAVSLEAIYLSLFIQMTVNRNTASLKEVEEDIDEIQEDVDEIQEDVDEIQEDVDEIEESLEEVEEDLGQMSDQEKIELRETARDNALTNIESQLSNLTSIISTLQQDIEKLKK